MRETISVFRIPILNRIRIGSGINWVCGSGLWILSGSMQAGKNDPLKREKLRNVMFWSAECSPWRAGGFLWGLQVLQGGLRINTMHFSITIIWILLAKAGSGSGFNEYGFATLLKKVDSLLFLAVWKWLCSAKQITFFFSWLLGFSPSVLHAEACLY
jgi:hypothetical protein